uniref:Ring finger protein 208 n=1 Tax=Podarcis muralis TaxID=64176 RepID=A0A670KHE7_PODMU
PLPAPPPDVSQVTALLMSCLKGPPGPNRKFHELNRKFPNEDLLANRKFSEANRKFPPNDEVLAHRKFPPNDEVPPGHEVIANEGVAKPLDPPPLFYPATGAEVIANQYAVPEVIANQYALPASPPSAESLECPTCGHAYNSAHKRPRLLSCLHSVCEECLQILYQSCPKYKFISCPSCKRETVLFTDYGLAALAVNTRLLARLPPAQPANRDPPPWGAGESERGCYQSFRQYCGAACNCRVRNPVASCAVM